MRDWRRRLTDRVPAHGALCVVLVIVAAGFVRVLTEHWRQGTGLIAGALLVAGVARLLLPDDRAGLLAVRTQAVDALCYLGLGVVMVVLAVTIPMTPFVVG